MNWNGEEWPPHRHEESDGVISLGIIMKILLGLSIGVMGTLAAKVIDHGERLSAVDAKFQYIAEGLHRLENKLDSVGTRRGP